MPIHISDLNEWIEADGLGGFASGTVTGVRTRRYHALLLAATTPPTGRMVLVNGFEAWVDGPQGRFALSSQFYGGDVRHPDGATRIESFDLEPWPRWTFVVDDARIEQQIFVPRGRPLAVLSWTLEPPRPGFVLSVRPLLSGRDYHSLHHENGAFHFAADVRANRIAWKPYEGVPGTVAISNGHYESQPDWYRNFLYKEERRRGLDFSEDLASPGTFSWEVSSNEAFLILAPVGQADDVPTSSTQLAAWVLHLRQQETRRRRQFASPLVRAADSYLVSRGEGLTLVAGYPWFTDWGRDTFIAMRGICLATGRLDEARRILLQWADTVSEGMLPNRFLDAGEGQAEFNSVDASLWYIVAIFEWLRAMDAASLPIATLDRATLQMAVSAILDGYSRGTRHGIRMDEDGLLAAGGPGTQLTWMDAKIGDWVVTPRVGKPVEIQALWLNALWIGSHLFPRWLEPFERGRDSFRRRFWNPDTGGLYDVVDVNHQAGTADPTLRPNQIFAVGGLPIQLLFDLEARSVVEVVESRLLTPLGLRSLAPGEPGYGSRYEGDGRTRDSVYHQGTVWPWLMGGFVEAWVRVRGGAVEARREARERFLRPLLAHVTQVGLGHLPEVADADPPHTAGGCPFQAWSVGEALRLEYSVLAEGTPGAVVAARPAS